MPRRGDPHWQPRVLSRAPDEPCPTCYAPMTAGECARHGAPARRPDSKAVESRTPLVPSPEGRSPVKEDAAKYVALFCRGRKVAAEIAEPGIAKCVCGARVKVVS